MRAADSPMRYHSPASTVSSEALPLSAADLIGRGKKTPTKGAHEHLLHFGIEGDGAPLALAGLPGVCRVALAGGDDRVVILLAATVASDDFGEKGRGLATVAALTGLVQFVRSASL